MEKPIKYGSVCSGIESASVAWHPLGWRLAWFAEIDKFPSAVLAHHYPEIVNHGDMLKLPVLIAAKIIEAPDILVGGTPCQSFSIAGLRKSMTDARGQLTLAYVELLNAIDDVRRADGRQECIAVWENVPGCLNTSDNAFGCFLGALAGEDAALQPAGKRWSYAGCVYGPQRTIAWRVLDAQYFGVAQRRRRIIVVATARKDIDPAKILFEFEGMRRDTAPRREAGKSFAHDVAPSFRASCRGGAHGDTRGQDPVIACFDRQSSGEYGTAPIASTVSARDYKSASDLIAHTLRGEGFDASEDGTGRGTPLVPVIAPTLDARSGRSGANSFATSGGLIPEIAFSCKDHGGDATENLAPTMRAMGHSESHANAGGHLAVAYAIQERAICENTDAGPDGIGVKTDDTAYTMEARTVPQAVAYSVALRGREGGATAELGDDAAGALRASMGGGDKAYVLTYGLDEEQNAAENLMGTLKARSKGGGFEGSVMTPSMAVRRLTPVECERLQGFPDGYTKINEKTADGPRYKVLGNSMNTQKMAWVGCRIQAAIRGEI